MNRSQRRRAQHQAKAKKTDAKTKQLSARARFEQDLRTALLLEDIKLVNAVPGQGQDAAGQPTGDVYWVFTVYAAGRFLSVKSGRGPLATIAAGVTKTVREAIANPDGRATNGDVPLAALQTKAPEFEPVPIKQKPPERGEGTVVVGEEERVLIHPIQQPPEPIIALPSELSLGERIKRAQAQKDRA